MGPRTLAAALSVALIPVLPAVPANADEGHLDVAVAALPGLAEQMMAKTGVPGIAIGVVHGDRLIYSEGFGVRSTKDSAPVTPDTVFQVASVSKPVGASAVAAAIGKGGVKWSDPVVKHMPSFKLRDPWVTRKATIGDLYSHRSGLPGNTGNDLESFGVPVKQIIHRMRYVPLNPFRISYAYSNFGMTVGGRAVAESRDESWPAMTRKLLFKPLGMSHSSYRHSDFVKQDNRATLHQQVNGRWVTSSRQPDAQAPAGGLSSSVVDMAKWLRMELANGRFEGAKVVPAGPLAEARSLQIRTSPPGDDATSVRGYAYGMDTEADETGHVRWAHSGAFSAGAATRILMIPDYDVGLVVLTNGWPVGVPEAIGESFAELLETGELTKDWLSVVAPVFAPFTTPNRAAFGKPKPADPVPAAPLNRYVGTYRGDYVGKVVVRKAKGRLVLKVGNQTRRLRHWNANTFAYKVADLPPGFIAGVRFRVRKGSAVSVNLEEVSADLSTLGIAHR